MSTAAPRATALRLLCSMATAPLLRTLVGDYQRRAGHAVQLIAAGGVDAVRRVMDGEQFDLVILASDAIEGLSRSHRVLPHSHIELVRSSVAVAVPAGAPHPDIGSEAALRAAVLAAPRIGFSSGPSGRGLIALLQRWGIEAQVRPRLVQTQPGVPVGGLLAGGEVALGFQQYSELQGLAGIELLGTLPAACAIETVFSGAVGSLSQQPRVAAALLSYLHSADTAEIKRQHGLSPA